MPVPHAPGRRLRVLIVDDDDAVARAMARTLGSIHHVETANSGHACRAILAAGKRFDTIVMDNHLGDTTASALVAEIVAIDGAQARRILIASGDVTEGVGDLLVLRKPFAKSALCAAIEQTAQR